MPDAMQAILIQGPYGLWMLGERTPHGIQMSIENFGALGEARAHLLASEMNPLIEVEGVVISYREAAIAVMVRRGAGTLAAAAACVKTSIVAGLASANSLHELGLVVLGPDAKRVGDRQIGLTASGIAIADRLIKERI